MSEELRNCLSMDSYAIAESKKVLKNSAEWTESVLVLIQRGISDYNIFLAEEDKV